MKRTTGVFFTSDWHIGHENVIRFDNRPFCSLEDMHIGLVRRFNATVPQNSITYFLGDMGLCKENVLSTVIKQLNGKKIIVLGNHDRNADAMLRMGFDAAVLGATLEIAKEVVTLSHYPLLGVKREDTTNMRGAVSGENWHGESRHSRRAFSDNGQFHLHGHTHKGPEERLLGRQWDMGLRANSYLPVSISAVESWISKN